MLKEYLPVLLMASITIVVATLPIVIGKMLGKRIPSNQKDSQYECGFPAFADARSKFDVKFYLVAILFILFDLEIAFLYPWALVIKKVGWEAFIAVLFFLLLLAIGFVYEWQKGALEWE